MRNENAQFILLLVGELTKIDSGNFSAEGGSQVLHALRGGEQSLLLWIGKLGSICNSFLFERGPFYIRPVRLDMFW